MEVISVEEAHARMKAQQVSAREHVAFKCPICKTVQSMASLVRAGAPADKVENVIGFSCEGRFTGVGPMPREKDRTAKASRRREQRGCDWTLGGLFHIHELEVDTPNGRQPSFAIASPEEAQALETEAAHEVSRPKATA
jgi:hypothetical protein